MDSFLQQLEKATAFFKAESLARQTIKYEGEMALLVIDVQKEFCDPTGERGNTETKEASTRIQTLVPEFRKAGIPVYAIYFSREGEKKASEIDFYKFTPHNDDVLIAKDRNSAFEGSDIKTNLRKDKRKLLLACGFNLNACVKSTVLDARKEKFDVCLLEDLTGNDRHNSPYANDTLRMMHEKGVTIEQSGKVLEQILARKKTAPSA